MTLWLALWFLVTWPAWLALVVAAALLAAGLSVLFRR